MLGFGWLPHVDPGAHDILHLTHVLLHDLPGLNAGFQAVSSSVEALCLLPKCGDCALNLLNVNHVVLLDVCMIATVVGMSTLHQSLMHVHAWPV